MILFLFNDENKIYDYGIASTKFKVTRNYIFKYEQLIGEKID